MKSAIVPLALATVLAAAWVAILAIPGGVLLAAILVVGAPRVVIVVALVAFMTGLIVFWRRNRLSGIVFAFGTAAVFLLAALPDPTDSPLSWVADLVHVVYYRNALERQIVESRRRGIAVPVAAIGIDGFGSMTSGIAYDPTGQIVMPRERQSSNWKLAADQTELGVDGLKARHIIGGYYSWFHP